MDGRNGIVKSAMTQYQRRSARSGEIQDAFEELQKKLPPDNNPNSVFSRLRTVDLNGNEKKSDGE